MISATPAAGHEQPERQHDPARYLVPVAGVHDGLRVGALRSNLDPISAVLDIVSIGIRKGHAMKHTTIRSTIAAGAATVLIDRRVHHCGPIRAGCRDVLRADANNRRH